LQDFIQANTTGGEFIDIDRLLMGMAFQLCEEEDHKIVEDLRGNRLYTYFNEHILTKYSI
jgi:hypothetical protein